MGYFQAINLVFFEGVTNYSVLFKDGRRHQRQILHKQQHHVIQSTDDKAERVKFIPRHHRHVMNLFKKLLKNYVYKIIKSMAIRK